MRILLTLLCLPLLFAPAAADIPVVEINKVLDGFHRAASEADGDRYFGYFTEDAIFLGTALEERWTVDEFRAYAAPHFSQGKGWTYKPASRRIYLSKDEQTAWFDETLENANYGMTRGSGVLVLDGGSWKVAQYHLTLPVPNELIDDLVRLIESRQ